jgi:hypothetical protein
VRGRDLPEENINISLKGIALTVLIGLGLFAVIALDLVEF